jgi:hypothetical protein
MLAAILVAISAGMAYSQSHYTIANGLVPGARCSPDAACFSVEEWIRTGGAQSIILRLARRRRAANATACASVSHRCDPLTIRSILPPCLRSSLRGRRRSRDHASPIVTWGVVPYRR